MHGNRGDNIHETDVLIIGSEGAGARAAIGASDQGLSVIIATKGRIGMTGATMTAGADFTVDGKSAKEYCGLPGDDRDSPERFFEEIVREGFCLSNQELVEAYVEGAPIILKELIDWGMKIYAFESAHFQEMARGAITTGPNIVKTLRKQVKSRNIKLLEDVMILDLLKEGDRVVGGVGLNMNTGELIVIKARAIILATGGWQRVWSLTSAPHELSGDGQAMAYRAGAETIDMEMIQTTPGNIIAPPRFRGYSSIYRLNTKIDSGKMLNSEGERFMEKYDPARLEHTSKEVLSLGIISEVLAGRGTPNGGVWWSFKDADKARLKEIIKNTGKGSFFFEAGLDDLWQKLLNEGIFEVGVAAHFMIGGIRVNRNGETNIKGLYAAGECSSNLWGATRVASACSQVCIQGMFAAKAAAEYAKQDSDSKIDLDQVELISKKIHGPLERTKGRGPVEIRKEIQRIADEKVNIVREGGRLTEALQEIEKMKEEVESEVCVQGSKTKRFNREWIEALQLENLRQCLELTAASALYRIESRGAHYRTDYQLCDNDRWLRNTVIRLEDGQRKVTSAPLVITRLQPPGGKITYFESVGVGLASIKAKEKNS